MSEKVEKIPTTTKAKRTTKKVEKSADIKYTVQQLKENCRDLFKVAPTAFAGAFFDSEETDLYTKKEAAAKIAAFLKKEVK